MKLFIRNFFILTLGSLLDAIGFYFFLAPNNIAAGGINGLALVINSFFPQVPLGSLILTMSLLLLIIGFITIGSGFGIKTIYCSILIPLLIWLLEYTCPLNAPLGHDTLVQLIIGVFISGIGVAVLLNQNASTGGTDIASRILNKFYHIDLGKGLFIIDFFITLAAAATFGIEKGMYALLGVILYGIIIDWFIAGFNVCKYVTIITANSDSIRNFIVKELERGATIYSARGGYSNENREVVITIVNRREFIRLRDFIQNNDPTAFIFVQNTHEVLGEGFKSIN